MGTNTASKRPATPAAPAGGAAAPPDKPNSNVLPLRTEGTGTGVAGTGVTGVTDVHKSKLDPNDERLRLPRAAGGRRLKAGPIAVGAMLAGMLVFIAFLSMAEEAPARPKADQDEQQQTQAPAPGEPLPEKSPAIVELPESVRLSPDVPALAGASSELEEGADGDVEGQGPDLSTRVGVKEPDDYPRLPTNKKAVGRRGGASAGPLPEGSAEPLTQERQMELQQDRDAPGSDLFFGGSDEPPQSSGMPMPGPGGAGAAGAAGGGAGTGDDPNRQGRKNDFLDGAGANNDTIGKPMMRAPNAPFVGAGTIIPVALITGINSDLPGLITGRVTSHVYDTVNGRRVLIPQGSTVIASYDSMVAYGQSRVLVCWNRLVRPDGSSINLDCMPGTDSAGYSGFADTVDHHFGRLAAGVLMSAILSAGSQMATGNVGGVQPTLGQSATSGAAQAVNQAGQQIVRRNLDVQPTIKVRPGFQVQVLVSKDLFLSPYDDEE